ncbi:MCP four helix bundle domain-containing protein, partial [Pseudomonas gingeri]
RMTVIRQASVDMNTNQLPSVGYLSNVIEGVLRLRILSFRVLINREPAALQEADTRIAFLTDKIRKDQKSYADLPSAGEELAKYKEFAATLDTYLRDQGQMLELSRQNRLDDLRS